MGCIYRIVCIKTSKSYIGQTEEDIPYNRYAKHWYNAMIRKLPYPLYHAFRKYGIDEFYIELVCNCILEQLDGLEAYYAEQYESYVWQNGYNLAPCGRGQPRGYRHHEEAREKMRQCKLGKLTGVIAPEIRKKMGKSGKQITDETRKKVSENRKGISPRPRLSDEAVRVIRENADKLTQKQLGEKYNTGWRTISLIQGGKSYKHVL